MSEISQTCFTLKNINVSKLDKTHIIADMAETSFKTSPKNKKTKIKDILDEKKIENTLDDDKADRIVILNGMHKTIFYTTINGEKINADDILKQTYRCFHCHSDITSNDSFIGIPIKLIESADEKYFECVGICCDWSCAASHIKLRNMVNDNRFKSSYYLLSQMYYKVFKKYMPKEIASKSLFCYEVTKPYGGSLEKINKKHLSCTSLHKSTVSQQDKVLFSIQPIFYEELKK
jgi:hypothetical protein